jgi:hypothetical protein
MRADVECLSSRALASVLRYVRSAPLGWLPPRSNHPAYVVVTTLRCPWMRPAEKVRREL